MKFRKAKPSDAPFLESLFDNEEYGLYFCENDTTAQEWGERFDFFAEKECYIVCDETGDIGWIMYEFNDDSCFLDIIVMKYSLVGTGKGYQAFDTFIKALPPHITSVCLDVQQRNEHAMNFYLRYGFRISGEETQKTGLGEVPYFKMEYKISR